MKVIKPVLAFLLLGPVMVASAKEEKDASGDYRDNFLTITGYVHKELASWTKSNIPVRIAACLETRKDETQDGKVTYFYYKHMIFFPQGTTKGKYAVFGWDRGTKPTMGWTAFDGKVEIRSHVEIPFVDQGGPNELLTFQMNTEYLLRNGMTLVQPADFRSSVLSVPKRACPVWHYDRWDPKGVEKLYNAQGWRW